MSQVEQNVTSARLPTDETAAALRVEIAQNADTAATQAQAAEVQVLDRGLKEVADQLQIEVNERSQAMMNSLNVTAGGRSPA